jgi:uncharacterized membrane protein
VEKHCKWDRPCMVLSMGIIQVIMGIVSVSYAARVMLSGKHYTNMFYYGMHCRSVGLSGCITGVLANALPV